MPLTLYKRGKIWHYRGTVAGERRRGSTKSEKKSVAEKIVAAIQSEAWQSFIVGPRATLTFEEAAQAYRSAGKSIRFLGALEAHWGETRVMDITADAIIAAAKKLYPNAQNSTRNRHVIGPTQAVINHAAEMGLCNPIRVRRLKEAVKVKTPVTLEWLRAFMDHANPHLGALACFMFLTGARISEAIDVRWRDVDFEARRVLIRQSKISEERLAHMPAMLIVAISNIQSNREPGEKVFKYSSRFTAEPQWQKAVKRAGLEYLSFHCCRHGFATALLHKGVDPVTVAKLGGWASTQHVFKTYGHAMKDDRLADIIADADLTRNVISNEESEVKSTVKHEAKSPR